MRVFLAALFVAIMAGCGGGNSGDRVPPYIAPIITTPPASQTVTVGHAAFFTVAATGTAPMTYQWAKDGTAISGATENWFTLPMAQPSDAGNYTVTVANAAGHATSGSAALQVQADLVAPTFTAYPVDQSVVMGSSASFSVVVTGSAPLHYQWRMGSTPVGSDAATYDAIALAAVLGTYPLTVTVSNAAGSVTSNVATLRVTAQPEAPVITRAPASQSVTVGNTVFFAVEATGTAPITYQWAKDGAAVPGATEAWFALASAQLGDAGSYTVTVTNAAGHPTSAPATLQVSAVIVPPSITTYPVDQSVVVGHAASFSVVATGSAPLHYQWRLGSTAVGGDAATYDATTLATTVGTYPLTVTVSNTAGSVTSNVATLRVAAVVPPPVILTPPAEKRVVVGESAVLSVVADGGAPMHYHWKLGTTPVGTDSPTFDATTLAERVGSYPISVTVANAAGSVTSDVATLHVTLAPPLIAVNSPVSSGMTGRVAYTFDQGASEIFYTWTLLGGTLTSGQGTRSITFTPGAAGIMTLKVTALYLGEETSASTQIPVVEAPAPDIFCQSRVHFGATGMLASTPIQDGMTYFWTSNGNLTITSAPDNPVVTFNAGGSTGTGQLTVAVQNSAGDVVTQTRDFQVVSNQVLKHERAPGSGRTFVTATLLKNGRVLVAGGNLAMGSFDESMESLNPVTVAELFDPWTQTWKDAASMSVRRVMHTATRLANGKVLVTGGYNGELGGIVASAELYDPATDLWSSAGIMATPHYKHVATLLQNGKVLVVGSGFGSASTELFDPETNTWSSAASMTEARATPAATLLPNGWVLVAGGGPATAELYDPEANTWTRTRDMSIARDGAVGTLLGNGQVLVTGGTDVADPECYDLATNTWKSTGSILAVRNRPSVTLLQNGKVMVSGGSERWTGDPLQTTELYDPATNAWSAGGTMKAWHPYHTTVAMEHGHVLLVGARGSWSRGAVPERYDTATDTWSLASCLPSSRAGHTVTLMGNGKVLLAGGSADDRAAAQETPCYDPTTRTWAPGEPLPTLRVNHTATLLTNGKVLLAGGSDGSSCVASALCYDPVTNTWSGAGSMITARIQAVAARLQNGKVLVVGGSDRTSYLASAELYDPDTDTWSSAGSMTTARILHTATLLPSGKVLVTGGTGMMPGTPPFASAELYDPATNTWSTVASMTTARRYHTATLMANGKVLVVGGTDGTYFLNTVELYDPALNMWTPKAHLTTSRDFHSATLLPDGKVLVVGGRSDGGLLASAEYYDPILDSWPSAGNMAWARYAHASVHMDDGTVMLVGGGDSYSLLSTVEFWKR